MPGRTRQSRRADLGVREMRAEPSCIIYSLYLMLREEDGSTSVPVSLLHPMAATRTKTIRLSAQHQIVYSTSMKHRTE